jgi:ClpP class serine protease
MDIFFNLLLLFVLLSVLTPMFQQQMLRSMRRRQLTTLGSKRNSRVITLIHRQESLSLLGIPLTRFIDVDDSEKILRAIRGTDAQTPIDLILHTPGGLVLASEQIARALCRHSGKVTVFIPHYAMSGGTIIAMAADEIVMDPNAVAGPVDPQIGQFPAASILKAVERKEPKDIDDQTLILADIAAKALKQVKETVLTLLRDKNWEEAKAQQVAEIVSQGQWTHDYPLQVEELRALGLIVSTDMPAEVYDLMAFYPQPQNARPSVEFIPGPVEPRRKG